VLLRLQFCYSLQNHDVLTMSSTPPPDPPGIPPPPPGAPAEEVPPVPLANVTPAIDRLNILAVNPLTAMATFGNRFQELRSSPANLTVPAVPSSFFPSPSTSSSSPVPQPSPSSSVETARMQHLVKAMERREREQQERDQLPPTESVSTPTFPTAETTAQSAQTVEPSTPESIPGQGLIDSQKVMNPGNSWRGVRRGQRSEDRESDNSREVEPSAASERGSGSNNTNSGEVSPTADDERGSDSNTINDRKEEEPSSDDDELGHNNNTVAHDDDIGRLSDLDNMDLSGALSGGSEELFPEEVLAQLPPGILETVNLEPMEPPSEEGTPDRPPFVPWDSPVAGRHSPSHSGSSVRILTPPASFADPSESPPPSPESSAVDEMMKALGEKRKKKKEEQEKRKRKEQEKEDLKMALDLQEAFAVSVANI
jgi:hypothetical protein